VRRPFHEVWGCARGPVAGLAPQVRIVAGVAVFTGCMVAPTSPPWLAAITAAAVLVWLLACRLPGRVLAGALLLGLLLFLPFVLLAPLIRAETRGWAAALEVVWSVLLRGLSGLLVSVATVGSLSVSDLHQGLLRLPVPGIVAAILVQIVHQSGTLLQETARIASAMALRGATGRGRAGWRVLAAWPRVWLPRVLERAERVADAMELRGYRGAIHGARAARPGLRDALALTLTLSWVGVASALRWWGAR